MVEWYIHTMEYYTAIEKNELELYVLKGCNIPIYVEGYNYLKWEKSAMP